MNTTSIKLESRLRAPAKLEELSSPLVGECEETQALEQQLLSDQVNAQLNHGSPIKLLQDSSNSLSPNSPDLPISLRDHILEEVKGKDSPIKKIVNKFSPSKSKYVSTNKPKIGDSSDSDEGLGGFKLHAMD